jgi:hypothetical protein
MGTIPTAPRAAFLAWCQAHVNAFLAQADNIGLTEDQANAFKNGVLATNASDAAANTAKQAFRAATLNNSDTFGDLHRSASEMVRSIRTFAQNQNAPTSTCWHRCRRPPTPAPRPRPRSRPTLAWSSTARRAR